MSLKVLLACVGELKDPALASLEAEYLKRLGRYCRPQRVEVKVGRAGDLGRRLAEEAEGLEAAVPPGATRILLDPTGRLLSSEELARKLGDLAVGGESRLAFLVGGPDGFAADLRARADLVLSFSPMTFPHQLFRIMLLEQLYRAFTIQRGEPYHRPSPPSARRSPR